MEFKMKVTFGEVKPVRQMTGRPDVGSFGLDGEVSDDLNWFKCREHFHKRYKEDSFYFCHNPGDSERVACFLQKTEIILDLLGLSFLESEYSKTDKDYAMWINPSQFWKNCEMRRQLLTIFVRAAKKYDPDKDNYEEALYAQKYAERTKSAVMRFLFGFTKYTGKFGSGIADGWEKAFLRKTDSEVRKILVLPEYKEPDDCLIAGVIWN